MLSDKLIGVLGAGNMGEALIAGLIKACLVEPQNIIASRRSEGVLAHLSQTYGIRVTTNNRLLIDLSDIVVLAVKPQVMGEVLDQCRSSFTKGKVIISIAAGIKTSFLENHIGLEIPVVRVMPNTPALVGEAISPFCLGRFSGEAQALLATELFSAVGVTVQVEEAFMDAITAISGTGPAYIFYLLEGLIKAGEELGLPPHLCRALVRQTVYGSAKLVVETTHGPERLRAQVTSPQGTTHAAISFLETKDFLNIFTQAVFKAKERAMELGRMHECRE